MKTPKLNRFILSLNAITKLLEPLDKYNYNKEFDNSEILAFKETMRSIYLESYYCSPKLDINPLDIVEELQALCNSIDDLTKINIFFQNRIKIVKYPEKLDKYKSWNFYEDLKRWGVYYEIFEYDFNDVYFLACELYYWKIKGFNAISQLLVGYRDIPSLCNNDIPEIFKTPKAKIILDKLVKAGYLDIKYKLTDKLKSKAQIALFAELLGEELKLEKKEKWKHFERYWGVVKLSQIRYDSKEKIGKVRGEENIKDDFTKLFSK